MLFAIWRSWIIVCLLLLKENFKLGFLFDIDNIMVVNIISRSAPTFSAFWTFFSSEIILPYSPFDNFFCEKRESSLPESSVVRNFSCVSRLLYVLAFLKNALLRCIWMIFFPKTLSNDYRTLWKARNC